jgi:putative hydrolases of HD superfamily
MQSRAWLEPIEERLRRQLEFLVEIDRLKSVVRANRISDRSRRENTAEHSWHLAMFAITLAEHAVGEIAVDRVVRMLLVHDIVEIDAGDTYCYDTEGYTDKERRERAAAQRLFGMLPDDQASAFLALWEEFEAMQTPAAVLANAVDRLQPLVMGRFKDGGDWRFRARTREQILTRMDPIRVALPAVWSWVIHVVDEAFTTGRHSAGTP